VCCVVEFVEGVELARALHVIGRVDDDLAGERGTERTDDVLGGRSRDGKDDNVGASNRVRWCCLIRLSGVSDAVDHLVAGLRPLVS